MLVISVYVSLYYHCFYPVVITVYQPHYHIYHCLFHFIPVIIIKIIFYLPVYHIFLFPFLAEGHRNNSCYFCIVIIVTTITLITSIEITDYNYHKYSFLRQVLPFSSSLLSPQFSPVKEKNKSLLFVSRLLRAPGTFLPPSPPPCLAQGFQTQGSRDPLRGPWEQ